MALFSKWKTRSEDFNRLREIASAFFEGGFDFLVKDLRLESYVRTRNKLKRLISPPGVVIDEVEVPLPVKFRLILERLGPTFIKFGQILSMRSDLIPAEYATELKNLQEHVPPFSFEEVKGLVEGELKQPLKKVFKRFDEQPLASASLSQVHKATLKNGKIVAVKVQRPNIRKVIEQDLRIMYYVAHLIEKHSNKYDKYRPMQVVDEFSHWTVKELDFRYEGKNLEVLKKNFERDETVFIPSVHWDHCTEKLLVMDFVNGVSFNDDAGLKRLNVSKKQLAVNSANAILKQVFEHGFFHGDPHPGNLFALKTGKVVFLDVGIMGRIDERSRRDLSKFFLNIMSEEFDAAIKKIISLARVTEDSDVKGFKKELYDMFTLWYGSDLEQYDIVHLFYNSLTISSKYNVLFQPEFVLLAKTLVTMESTVKQLHPKFNFVKETKPYVRKLLRQEQDPIKRGKQLYRSYAEGLELLEDVPQHILKVIKKIEEGQIDIKLDSSELNKVTSDLYRMNALRALGTIIAALVLSSALILQQDTQPLAFGYSIGRFMFYGAIGLSIVLFLILLRRGEY